MTSRDGDAATQAFAGKIGEAWAVTKLALEVLDVLSNAVLGEAIERRGDSWQVRFRPEQHDVIVYIWKIGPRRRVLSILREAGIDVRIDPEKDNFLLVDLPQ